MIGLHRGLKMQPTLLDNLFRRSISASRGHLQEWDSEKHQPEIIAEDAR